MIACLYCDLFVSIMPWVFGVLCVLTAVFIWGCERDIAASKKYRLVRSSDETGENQK